MLPEMKLFSGIPFEIQVRTILQHAWAEFAHDRNYKFRGVLPDVIARRYGVSLEEFRNQYRFTIH